MYKYICTELKRKRWKCIVFCVWADASARAHACKLSHIVTAIEWRFTGINSSSSSGGPSNSQQAHTTNACVHNVVRYMLLATVTYVQVFSLVWVFQRITHTLLLIGTVAFFSLRWLRFLSFLRSISFYRLFILCVFLIEWKNFCHFIIRFGFFFAKKAFFLFRFCWISLFCTDYESR